MRDLDQTDRTRLRRYPYPWRAMLAICSDLDETPDRVVYRTLSDFLNSRRDTPLGRGLGLEVGNTIYFDMPPSQFAYWNSDDAGRESVRALIASGHIDCFHSFGDLATRRADAARALDELDRHGLRLECWVDHGQAVTNFGADIMCGEGDLPGADAYHADLTLAHGVRYIWTGRVTSVFGQNDRKRYAWLVDPAHPRASLKTLAKEAAKGLLARAGADKYAMHAGNRLLRRVRLRDDQTAWEFIRSDPYWGGISVCDQGRRLGEALTARPLERLIERGGATIFYTHLGKIDTPHAPWPEATRAALRHLAGLHHDGRLLVTTTRRLLGYHRARDDLVWKIDNDGGRRTLAITSGDTPLADLQGLTFYDRDPARLRVTIDGVEAADLVRNPPDHTGKPSVSLPWRPLDYPFD